MPKSERRGGSHLQAFVAAALVFAGRTAIAAEPQACVTMDPSGRPACATQSCNVAGGAGEECAERPGVLGRLCCWFREVEYKEYLKRHHRHPRFHYPISSPFCSPTYGFHDTCWRKMPPANEHCQCPTDYTYIENIPSMPQAVEPQPLEIAPPPMIPVQPSQPQTEPQPPAVPMPPVSAQKEPDKLEIPASTGREQMAASTSDRHGLLDPRLWKRTGTSRKTAVPQAPDGKATLPAETTQVRKQPAQRIAAGSEPAVGTVQLVEFDVWDETTVNDPRLTLPPLMENAPNGKK